MNELCKAVIIPLQKESTMFYQLSNFTREIYEKTVEISVPRVAVNDLNISSKVTLGHELLWAPKSKFQAWNGQNEIDLENQRIKIEVFVPARVQYIIELLIRSQNLSRQIRSQARTWDFRDWVELNAKPDEILFISIICSIYPFKSIFGFWKIKAGRIYVECDEIFEYNDQKSSGSILGL